MRMFFSEEDNAQGMPTLIPEGLSDVWDFYKEGEIKEGKGCIFGKRFFKDMCTKCIYFSSGPKHGYRFSRGNPLLRKRRCKGSDRLEAAKPR